MGAISTRPSRKEVLKFISDSASYGNLGLFVGAGFTKAVLNESEEVALSWADLLDQASTELGVDYAAIKKEGLSYPDIASQICQSYAAGNKRSFSFALSSLKGAIASLTCWYPDSSKRQTFGGYLDALDPAWIITTNYDLVIEALLTGRSIPIGPKDKLTRPKGIVPVYHLHGLRTNPEEIIIAQEDYIALFRPNEYRQIKLALMIKESTTLLLGYGLGDVNVLTALDWSKNVFSEGDVNYPHDVVQVLRKQNPVEKPYRDRNGVLIIETSDLTDFFEEYAIIRREDLEQKAEEATALQKLADEMVNPQQGNIAKFLDDQSFRQGNLKILSQFPVHLISGFISFLDKCIDETWLRSRPHGAFEGYNQNLIIIMDILTAFEAHKIPPALFQTAAYALERVAYYVGRNSGQSFAAAVTWDKRKGELSQELITELMNISKSLGYSNLEALLNTI
jgi:hypothetical protein